MSLDSKTVLRVNITISPKHKILEEVKKWLKTDNRKQITDNKKKNKILTIFTPNPEIINFAQKDEKFRQIVTSAQINIPDGAGIVWAMEKLHNQKIERIPGADFMLDLCDLCAKERLTVGLIGGRGQVALKTKECLVKLNKNLKIEVFESPEIKSHKTQNGVKHLGGGRQARSARHDSCEVKGVEKEYFNNLAKEIARKKISILFVALGFPKQEYFIESVKRQVSSGQDTSEVPTKSGRGGRQARSARHDSCEVEEFPRPLVLMSVGGSFDYLSGQVPRAPLFMREKGMEWLYRLVKEPWRLGRQIKASQFFWKILWEK